jgi:hypothetical protein
MWFYYQMVLPLLTFGLAAVICFSVVLFIVAHANPIRKPWRSYRKPRSG